MLVTTATANARVVDDIAEVLGIGAGADSDVLVQRGPLDRASLALSVVKLEDHAHRLAWLADHLGELEGSGIIYCLTVAGTEEIAGYLRAAGHNVLAYSGRSDPAERLAAEESLLNNEVKALVATSALGMGFDHPTLGFVINVGAPPSPIAYYQQVGRAGRATDSAQVILLPSSEDRAIWDYFASLAFPPERTIAEILDTLAASETPLSTPALETMVDLSRSRLEATLKVLDVEGAVHRSTSGWSATGQPWRYDTERYAKVAAVRRAEQDAMVAYATTERCRMRFLLDQLDDPYTTSDCGRCDNCRGDAYSRTTTATSLGEANARLARPGTAFEPKKMWPSAMTNLGIELSGRIAVDELAEGGRAVARFTDLGFGRAVREVSAPGAPDAPVPEALLRAAVAVLAEWKNEWAQRPAAIVTVGSHTHPQLIASFGAAIGSIGKLPVLGQVAHHGLSSGGVRSNSAHRLRAVLDAYRLDAPTAQALAGEFAGKTVLLIDDVTDSGWTLSVVARLLRRAGAGAVYPLTLGIVG